MGVCSILMLLVVESKEVWEWQEDYAHGRLITMLTRRGDRLIDDKVVLAALMERVPEIIAPITCRHCCCRLQFCSRY